MGILYLKMAMDLYAKRVKIPHLLIINSLNLLLVLGDNFNTNLIASGLQANSLCCYLSKLAS